MFSSSEYRFSLRLAILLISLLGTFLATRHYVRIVDEYKLSEQSLNKTTRLETARTRVMVTRQRIATEKKSLYETSELPYLQLDEAFARLECSDFLVARSGFYDRDVRIIASPTTTLTPTHVNELVACLKLAQRTPLISITEIDLGDVASHNLDNPIKSIEQEFPWAKIRRNR
ncbi:MAG: hypothetical protein KDB23_09780 [Planctomycetales bacterium]|nr:hypothetical protein [Planctomycetales bacterium]